MADYFIQFMTRNDQPIEHTWFVLIQHAVLELYCASSQNPKPAGRHTSLLGHIILSQPVVIQSLKEFVLVGKSTHDLPASKQAWFPDTTKAAKILLNLTTLRFQNSISRQHRRQNSPNFLNASEYLSIFIMPVLICTIKINFTTFSQVIFSTSME